jgi:hypothetical protein
VDGLTVQGTLWSWLAEIVRDVIDGIEGWVAGFGPIDFILAVAVVWSVFWIWSTLRAMTRLGPVEVSLLEHDAKGNAEPDVNALTALLRERLARSGLLPPPEVPAGSPQTNLIAAVESSGHPQAGWIAQALQLLPHPPRSPEYKLSATLLTGTNGGPAGHGLRYWLRPKHEGHAQLETVKGQTSEAAAVCRAATDIFLEISRDAVHVFPHWAQWDERPALDAYIEGIEARLDDKDRLAGVKFQSSRRQQVANLLPHLQLANLREKSAAETKAPRAKAFRQAHVLRRYLDIGVACSDLVAARYRAGIVAARLANACGAVNHAEAGQIATLVGLTKVDGSPVDDLPEALHELAAREAKDAYRLVGRFHVLLDKRRLRHQYEPTGIERRRLRRTIAISRYALKLRHVGEDDSSEARFAIWWRRATLRCLHLGLFRASAGWNAHYNAGCFYSLLYKREFDILHETDPEAVDHPDVRTLRRRAYEELNAAIDKSGGELPGDWLTTGDPSLQPLRELGEPEWHLLVRRHTGARPEQPQLPGPAWGDPHRRRNEWIGAAAVFVVLAALVVVAFFKWWTIAAGAGIAAAIAASATTALLARRNRVWIGLTALLIAALAWLAISRFPAEGTLVTAALMLAAIASGVFAWRVHQEAQSVDELSIAARKRREAPGGSSGSPPPAAPPEPGPPELI